MPATNVLILHGAGTNISAKYRAPNVDNLLHVLEIAGIYICTGTFKNTVQSSV